MGCEHIPVAWIESYLKNRKQFVKIGSQSSRSISVPSGVPQGSHLGPLLFIAFINDVPEILKFLSCLIFADDIKFYAIVKNIMDQRHVQDDLNSFYDWSVKNKLFLNLNKCVKMSFSRKKSPFDFEYNLGNIKLARVEFMRDLGVIFTPNLSFSRHIDYIISKAMSMLGFLKRTSKDFCDPYTLKILYSSFIRSQLEYASVVWSPHYLVHSDRIESVQKKFLLYALRHLGWKNWWDLPPYKSRLALIGLQSLKTRRDIAGALFARDVLCARIDCPDLLNAYKLYVPERNLRSHRELLSIGFHRTNYGGNEPVVSTSRNLNQAQEFFDWHISRALFKERISQIF